MNLLKKTTFSLAFLLIFGSSLQAEEATRTTIAVASQTELSEAIEEVRSHPDQSYIIELTSDIEVQLTEETRHSSVFSLNLELDNNLIIDGQDHRIFWEEDSEFQNHLFSIGGFSTEQDIEVIFRNLNFSGAKTHSLIKGYSSSAITIQNCRFENNQINEADYLAATSALDLNSSSDGMAINSSGTLAINQSQFFNNRSRIGTVHYSGNTLNVSHSRFESNQALHGGAISAPSEIREGSISDNKFSQNEAYKGGALYVKSSSILERNFFDSNQALHKEGFENSGLGGAIYFLESLNQRGLINQSSFLRNTSNGHGGAIYGYGVSALIIKHSQFEENQALEISHSGGALALEASNSFATRLVLKNSNFINNTAFHQGGGLYLQGNGDFGISAYLYNVTLASNQANSFGGGIYFNHELDSTIVEDFGLVRSSKLSLFHTTIISNRARAGGGVHMSGLNAYSQIKNSILANNRLYGRLTTRNSENCWGTFNINFGYNFIDDINFETDTCRIFELTSDTYNTPLLSSPELAANGGPTLPGARTFLTFLPTDENLVDRANGCLPTDSRGYPRGEAPCTIGATESEVCAEEGVLRCNQDPMIDQDGDGVALDEGDCNDNDSSTHLFADEIENLESFAIFSGERSDYSEEALSDRIDQDCNGFDAQTLTEIAEEESTFSESDFASGLLIEGGDGELAGFDFEGSESGSGSSAPTGDNDGSSGTGTTTGGDLLPDIGESASDSQDTTIVGAGGSQSSGNNSNDQIIGFEDENPNDNQADQAKNGSGGCGCDLNQSFPQTQFTGTFLFSFLSFLSLLIWRLKLTQKTNAGTF